jgi:hypothetical protein
MLGGGAFLEKKTAVRAGGALALEYSVQSEKHQPSKRTNYECSKM